jgi:hypothetical protein
MASLWLVPRAGKCGLARGTSDSYNADEQLTAISRSGVSPIMEKEYIDRAKAIREGILQLRDSL